MKQDEMPLIPLRYPNDPKKQADHIERVLKYHKVLSDAPVWLLRMISKAAGEILDEKRNHD